jgi:hypothetical protein
VPAACSWSWRSSDSAAARLSAAARAACIATAAVLMVPSLAVQVLTGAARQDVIRYLPLRAADALVRGSSSAGALSPLAALRALAAEIAVLLVAGAMLLSRRDA